MGLFNFVGELASAAVKVAVTPLAIVKDVADLAMGNEAENTKNIIKSAGDDFEKAFDEFV